MGMEYARLYFDFFTSEKTQYLIDECGDSGPMCLMRLWVRAGQRNNDGVFNKSGRALEKIAGWKGKSGKLIETLTDPDFLFLDKISDDEFSLHNWDNNNPHLGEKAKQIRTDKARRAGLASAEKKKQEATTSQLQVNSESTASQLNSTQGQLGSTNVTKRNVTKGNLIKEKNIKKEKTSRRDNIPYEDILNDLNTRAGTAYLANTEATIIHINNAWDFVMKHPTYKDDPISAFFLVNEIKVKECKDDPEQRKWLKPSVIYRMGPKNNNFENNLNQPKQQTYEEKYGRWGKRIIT